MSKLVAFVCLFSALVLTSPAKALVSISHPSNGQTTNLSTAFTATANTDTCGRGVASIGVYVDGNLVHVTQGNSLNTTLRLSEGPHNTIVQAWDFCGGTTKQGVYVTARSQPGVWVSSPLSGKSSPQPVFVASGTTPCGAGVAAMGLYIDDKLVHVEQGNRLNRQFDLPAGSHNAIVQSWDHCGGVYKTPVYLTVVGGVNVLNNLQARPEWRMSGQKTPLWNNCIENPGPDPCAGVIYSFARNILNPTLTGLATRFDLGGSIPYSCVLYWLHLIGAHSNSLPDGGNHPITASTKNFTYDASFYLTTYDEKYTQALEFDINWFLNSTGMIWGVECRLRGGHEWTLWNNAAKRWDPTGIPCNPNKDTWNRVTISGTRNANNTLTYQSITLNGQTIMLNHTMAPFWVPGDWYGITVNYQMDGDERQTAIKSFVDKFSLSYW